MPEAPLEETEAGWAAAGAGWYVLNAKGAVWEDAGELGVYTRLGEGEERFPQLGINIGVLQPGQAACMYHREPNQEGFLVLWGECLLLVEGEERRLGRWDYFHCPPETDHVLVGAGDGLCAILAVGSRAARGVVYSRSDVALAHGAGVEQETSDPAEAYARFPEPRPTRYQEGWLPS